MEAVEKTMTKHWENNSAEAVVGCECDCICR